MADGLVDQQQGQSGAAARSLPFHLEPGQLPAGGDDPSGFDWREAWYPVQFLRDLDRDRPTPFVLLDRAIVLWWDRSAQAWRAFEDRCPHRLVPLSEGRITEDGLLECPYHGWAFDGTGQCDRIPQAPPDSAACSSPRSCAMTLPTAERQGLLFVYAGDPNRSDRVPIPVVPYLDETPNDWVCMDIMRDLPYDATTLLENVIDSSHICFTHHNTIGKRTNAAPMDLEIADRDRLGFRGIWPEGPRKGTLGSQETIFIAPATLWHDLTLKRGGRTLTVVYATPTRRGQCRTFARFPFAFPSKLPSLVMKLTPQWLSHPSQNGILEDDQIFLHHQERTLETWGPFPNHAQAFYLPTAADALVLAFRQWTEKFKTDPFPGQTLGPILGRRQLLDRYESHTVHCKACRTALARVRQLRTALAIAAAAGWTVAPILAALGLGIGFVASVGAIALASAIGWWRLGALERGFIEGRTVPPRNFPTRTDAKTKAKAIATENATATATNEPAALKSTPTSSVR